MPRSTSHAEDAVVATDGTVGQLIRELRCGLGWSQGRLAAALCTVSRCPTVTRETVSRWENGRRSPGPFWLPHIGAALQVPLDDLEREVRRRDVIKLAGASFGSVMIGPGTEMPIPVGELYASIAAGSSGSLAAVQTSHRADLVLARLAAADRAARMHLLQWMVDADSDVLRVNAAGVLAKNPDPAVAGRAIASLLHDGPARARYLNAVTERVGWGVPALATELANPRDAGARWCSAWLLSRDGSTGARKALVRALRTEPVTENIRTIGLLLNGDDPCT